MTIEELQEARRVIGLDENGPREPEAYTCHGCHGSKLLTLATPKEREDWANLRKFAPNAKTLCALAWDSYNTDGDCLGEK